MSKPSEVGTFSAGESRFREAFEDDVVWAVLGAELAFDGLVAVFVDGVDVGLDPLDLGLGVHPAVAMQRARSEPTRGV